MFQRFTDKTRRALFFARYEAGQAGSKSIMEWHVLLGLAREDRPMMGQIAPAEDGKAAAGAVRSEVEKRFPAVGQKIDTSVDLPLSPECSRGLALAEEAADRLGHRGITPAHILLGLMELPGSRALEILRAVGAEEQAARTALEKFASGNPPAPGSKAAWRAAAPERSESWVEGRTTITETERRFGGRAVTVVERWTESEDGKRVTYTHEIRGPGKTERHETEFEL